MDRQEFQSWVRASSTTIAQHRLYTGWCVCVGNPFTTRTISCVLNCTDWCGNTTEELLSMWNDRTRHICDKIAAFKEKKPWLTDGVRKLRAVRHTYLQKKKEARIRGVSFFFSISLSEEERKTAAYNSTKLSILFKCIQLGTVHYKTAFYSFFSYWTNKNFFNIRIYL